MSLQIQLPQFEGPLALLLYLIRKEEMDIMNININQITSQYLESIKILKELDLDTAGEFVAMAATLIQIKSRMLIPQYDENGEIVENEDPRKELVQKLLEYQKYQEASKLLYERPLVGRDIWLRGSRENLEDRPEEISIEDNGLFSLISAYRKMIKSAKKRIHKVTTKVQSISQRVLEIKDRLIMGHRLAMRELITNVEDQARQTLITFLSLLELGKLGFVGLYQSDSFADIWIETKKPIEADAISRVEEYDTVNSDLIADSLFAQTAQSQKNVSFEDFEAEPENNQAELESLEPEQNRLDEDVATDEEIIAAEKELGESVEV
jgi:segregation and condensation protein A